MIRIHSEAAWKEYISEYLENQFAGNFQLVTCKKEQKNYNLSFETKDSNKIQFQVKYRIGGCVTAWGEITWIFQKHVVDDFPTQIAKNIINDSNVNDIADIKERIVAPLLDSLK